MNAAAAANNAPPLADSTSTFAATNATPAAAHGGLIRVITMNTVRAVSIPLNPR